MKKIKEMFNDPETSDIFKTVSIFSIFVLFFGLTLTIRNANDTFAADANICPDGLEKLANRCYKQFESEDDCTKEAPKYNLTCTPVEDSDGGIVGYEVSVDIITVTYDYKGGSVKKTSEQTYKGNYITLPSLSKYGYEPLGWYYNGSNGAVRAGDSEGSFPVNGNITLYARWEPKTYTITFDSNGGTNVTAITAEYDSTVTLPTPEKSGFEFTGWWYEGDAGEEDDEYYGTSYTVKDNIKLVAGWKEIKTQTVKLDFNDGTTKPTEKIFAKGTVIYGKDLPTPTREGYTFDGWWYEGDVGTEDDQNICEENFTGYPVMTDITLVAHWKNEQKTEYQVTFDVYDGKLYEGTKELTSLTIKLSDLDYSKYTAVKDNKTFNGWTLTKGDCKEPYKTGTKNLEKDTTIYACYTDNTPSVVEHQVTFDVDGGKLYNETTELSTLTIKLSSIDYSKFTAKKDNKTFNGWTLTKGDCKEPYKTGTKNLEKDTTLYACYTDNTPVITEYQVTFDVDGGKLYEGTKELTSLTQKLSSLDYSKYVAKKDNNTFNGWSTTSTCTNPLKTGTLKLEKNTTLYACYTEDKKDNETETDNKTYQVTFKLDGGTLYKSNKKQSTNKFTLSTLKLSEYTAKKSGYTFEGWSADSKCTKPSKTETLKIEKNTTLYACYTKNNASTTDKTDDEAEKNPQTGNALLYLLFITGIIALGYTGYKNSSVKK